MLRPRRTGKGACQLLQAVERMHRSELVDIGHHRPHAAGQRLEAILAQQRVGPGDALALAAQALHLVVQRARVLAVEAIGHDQDMRPLR